MIISAEIQEKLLRLRRDFDDTFASPPPQRIADHEDLLGLRIGGDSYALRVREISGFASAGRIVPLPTRIPEILGVAGVRGTLVPVISLAALLGYASNADAARWLALIGKPETLGLAFGEFEGHLRILCSEATTPEIGRRKTRFIEAAVRTGTLIRSILSVPSILSAVKGEATGRRPAIKEE